MLVQEARSGLTDIHCDTELISQGCVNWVVCASFPSSHPFLNFCLSTIFTTLGSFYALLFSIGFLLTTLPFPLILTSSLLFCMTHSAEQTTAWLTHIHTHTHTHTQGNVQQCSRLELLFKIMDISDLMCYFLPFHFGLCLSHSSPGWKLKYNIAWMLNVA